MLPNQLGFLAARHGAVKPTQRSNATRPGPAAGPVLDWGVLVPGEHHIGEFHDWVRAR